ncbi:hypothetical protein DPMN_028427 [Dreissena polymorpha]|uniref:Uncharacterized protein n=1 Tax=Dreissena polymorpha TaxID=45954 RepID=A0A9D4LVF3_DREPO|nr:hypothetical protein DPMN_028427 [Dreissena polymorpha]
MQEPNWLTYRNDQLTGYIFGKRKTASSRLAAIIHCSHVSTIYINTYTKTGPLLGGHVFSPIWTILEIIRDNNKTKVLTKFHDDSATFVTSRVFTMKTAPSTALAAMFFNGQ